MALVNKIAFQTTTGFNIEMYITKENDVRVILSLIDEAYEENEFKIVKSAKECTLVDGDTFIIGDFIVEKTDKGYTLYTSDKKKIYTSEVEMEDNKNGTLVPIETEWDREGLVQILVEKRTYYNNENFYGMGEASDTLTLNNEQFELYHTADLGNQALVYIPYYFTNNGYATYYNANSKDIFEFLDDSENTRTVYFKTKSRYFDYYMFSEVEPRKAISKFYAFTNSNSLLPRWSFGYIQSKFGYETEEEVYQLLEDFEKYDIPVSAIVIDFHWYKRMGDLDWDLDRFPNHKKMYETLKEKNIKLITISQPFYTKDSKNYEEFDNNDIFAKRVKEVTKPVTMVWGDWWCMDSHYGSIINPIAEGASELIGEKYIQMKKNGLDGFWIDLGEPENVPPQAYFNKYTEEEFHLYFGSEWIKIIHNAIEKAFPEERTFILSRCGFSGSAGYNLSIWSGDSSATFTNLEKQIPVGINAGLSGFSYWGSDAGGFISQLKLPVEELYVRWMQFAAFTPVFRTHGKKTPREPWCYDDTITDYMRDLIKLRYKMLPYIYSTAYQTYQDGVPMMRPMMLENPEDKKAWEMDNQFYFGDYLLVAPIVKKMSEESHKKVYLPEGKWYDFYSYEQVGCGLIEVEAVIDKIPVFIKEGAILVFEDEIIVTESNSKSIYTWYLDDGESNAYLEGDYEAIDIILENQTLLFKNIKEEKTIAIKYIKENGDITKLDDIILTSGETVVNL